MKKIIITGNVGRDPEMKSSQNGEPFATFSVAISVGKNKTDWCDITCNGKLTDIARNYIKKGSKLLIEGFPSVSAYNDRGNNPIGVLKIYANNIEFISSKEHAEGTEGKNNPSVEYRQPEVPDASNKSSALTGDDIPF